MMKKAVIGLFLLIVMMGTVAAYDLEVVSITPVQSPVEAGQSTQINVVIENNDNSDPFVRTTESLNIQFGDGATDSAVIPDLAGGAQTTLSFTHTYTEIDTETFVAEIQNLVNDSVASNNLLTFNIAVTNDAPVIAAIAAQEIVVGDAFSLDVDATDDEGDSITWDTVDSLGLTIDGNGLISGWTPTAAGQHTVTVTADDGFNTPTERTFTITVLASTATLSVSPTSFAVGGNNQDRGVSAQAQITLTNTGTQTISSIAAALDNNFPTEYNAAVSIADGDLTLARGEQTTITVTLDVPANQDAELEELGTVQITGVGNPDTPNTITVPVTLQAESFLQIDSVEIDIDGDEEKISNGENFDTIKEGDEVIVTIEVENLYSNSQDIEIEDVYVRLRAEDGDWDIDEESNEENIDADDKEKFIIRFDVDDRLDDDRTDVIIEVFGEDEEGNFIHYDSLEFEFEIEREDDEITIREARFARNPIQCTDRSVEFLVEIENTGTDDQNDAAISIKSTQLDFNINENNIELDEDDNWDESYTLNLPNGLEAGSYIVIVESYYNDDRKSDSETVVLDVICGVSGSQGSSSGSSGSNSNSGSSNQGSSSTVVVTAPTPTTQPTFGNAVYGQPIDNSRSSSSGFTNSPSYLILLAVVAVLVVVGIVGMLFSLGGAAKR